MGCFIILLLITGIFYLDVTENGQGSFEKSQTGEFLERYGYLDEALVAINATRNFVLTLIAFGTKLVGNVYAGLRPVLQSIEKQAQLYIPEVIEFGKSIGNYIYEKSAFVISFFQDNVFVGAFSLENMRRVAKEGLTLVWTSICYWVTKLHELIGNYLNQK